MMRKYYVGIKRKEEVIHFTLNVVISIKCFIFRRSLCATAFWSKAVVQRNPTLLKLLASGKRKVTLVTWCYSQRHNVPVCLDVYMC